MSTTIMAACWPLKMSSTQKSVLISLADNANDQGECWPSIDTIAERTCLHRSNVIVAIKALEGMGHLVADRSNGRHTRYTITPNLDLFGSTPSRSATGSGARPVVHSDSSRSATGSTARPNPSRSATQPVAERDSNRQEPSITKDQKQKPRAHEQRALPDWVPVDAWRDWVEFRKAGKAKFTERAELLSLRSLERLREHGHDPTAVIEQSIERGWTGLFAVKPNDGDSRGDRSRSRIPSLADRAVEDWRERGIGEASDTGRASGGAPVGADDRSLRPPLDVAVR